jgi:hypothetical protein
LIELELLLIFYYWGKGAREDSGELQAMMTVAHVLRKRGLKSSWSGGKGSSWWWESEEIRVV